VPAALKFQPTKSAPPRKRWTRSGYEALTSPTLSEQSLELVEGDLISKTGKKRPHVIGMSLMLKWLVQTFTFPFVNSEAPIDVALQDNPSTEPEPDLIVLNRDQAEFLHSNPEPDNLHLVIEVADTTLAFDLSTKAACMQERGLSSIGSSTFTAAVLLFTEIPETDGIRRSRLIRRKNRCRPSPPQARNSGYEACSRRSASSNAPATAAHNSRTCSRPGYPARSWFPPPSFPSPHPPSKSLPTSFTTSIGATSARSAVAARAPPPVSPRSPTSSMPRK